MWVCFYYMQVFLNIEIDLHLCKSRDTGRVQLYVLVFALSDVPFCTECTSLPKCRHNKPDKANVSYLAALLLR